MVATGAEIVKIAVTASRLSDSLMLRALGRSTRVPMALIAMGEAGIPSRVLAGWMGSCWTYAGDGVAPGQLVPPGCRRIQVPQHPRRHRDLRRARPTRLVSPAMHNAAFRATHRDAVYLPLAAADFEIHDVCGGRGAARRERHRALQGKRLRALATNAIPSAGASGRQHAPPGWRALARLQHRCVRLPRRSSRRCTCAARAPPSSAPAARRDRSPSR